MYPRGNFNDFVIGITTIFTILIGDGWNEIMYDHMRSLGFGNFLFFLSLYIFGNLILLNLFLAILLKRFDEKPEVEAIESEKKQGTLGKFKTALSQRLGTFVSKFSKQTPKDPDLLKS